MDKVNHVNKVHNNNNMFTNNAIIYITDYLADIYKVNYLLALREQQQRHTHKYITQTVNLQTIYNV